MTSIHDQLYEGYKAAQRRIGLNYVRSLPKGLERIRAQREVDRLSRDFIVVASPELPPAPPALVVADEQAEILRPFRWKAIIRDVCAKHGISLNELMSRRRFKAICAARHECFYRLKNETALSLPQVGRVMGGFDHTTVLAGVRRHEKRMAERAQAE